MEVVYPDLHKDEVYGKGDEWLKSREMRPDRPEYDERPKELTELAKSRLYEFISQRDKLIDLLAHYTKIKRHWTLCDSAIKITGISVGGISGVVTVVITPIVAIPLVGIIMGSFTAFDLFLTEALSIGLTARKKKIFREVCECLNMGIAKMWTYQNKALSDQIITDIEMEGARNIVRECINEIREIKKRKHK